jgi:nicotinate-nucleotide adenylyltransferase
MQLIFGGSFDPVHNGHVALAGFFTKLLLPDALRIVPAGDPWQKPPLTAAPEDRIAMLQAAFQSQPVPVIIDRQELQRAGPSYAVDTLRAIRRELGAHASLVFVMGADQLVRLDTWHEWTSLFELAHLCAASRPGFSVDQLPLAVGREFTRRAASAEQMRQTAQGLTCIASNLAIDVSSTQVRAALQRREPAQAFLPPAVLDYIQRHNLYGAEAT